MFEMNCASVHNPETDAVQNTCLRSSGLTYTTALPQNPPTPTDRPVTGQVAGLGNASLIPAFLHSITQRPQCALETCVNPLLHPPQKVCQCLRVLFASSRLSHAVLVMMASLSLSSQSCAQGISGPGADKSMSRSAILANPQVDVLPLELTMTLYNPVLRIPHVC